MSINVAHTQGPWLVMPEECDKPYIRVRGTALGGRYKVANVVTPVYEGVLPQEANETRRNAQLIAAAPELLEAPMTFSQGRRNTRLPVKGPRMTPP